MRTKRLPIVIYSPRPSKGAAQLALTTPCYRVDDGGPRSAAGARLMRNGGYVLINWGSSQPIPEAYRRMSKRVLNIPQHVDLGISKLRSCTILSKAGIPCVEVTDVYDTANKWYHGGSTVFHRRDRLSGGEGITVCKPGNRELPRLQGKGDFYAKYWKKTHEYRVHVFLGHVVDIQQKRRRTERTDNYDPMIRNHANDWVFCHDNLRGSTTELGVIGDTATKACTVLGLDFGAVDILARFKEDGSLSKHIVCEVNTAPGLEGTTVTNYSNAIRGM